MAVGGPVTRFSNTGQRGITTGTKILPPSTWCS